MVLEYGAEPPTDCCVRCGRPDATENRFSLRNSRDFRTWFGRRPDLALGLCRKHTEDHSVSVALTWSMLAVGTMLVIVGVLTIGWVPILLGLAAMCVAGRFRATSPVSVSELTESRIIVLGAAEAYLRNLPSAPVSEERSTSSHATLP